MPLNPPDDMSTLFQVMAWWRQAASHYLNQCQSRFMSPYGIIRPQWVKDPSHFNLVYEILCISFEIQLDTVCPFSFMIPLHDSSSGNFIFFLLISLVFVCVGLCFCTWGHLVDAACVPVEWPGRGSVVGGVGTLGSRACRTGVPGKTNRWVNWVG